MVNKAEDFRLTLLGKEITPADSAKDLGVLLDSSLTYNEHVASPRQCLAAWRAWDRSIELNTLSM